MTNSDEDLHPFEARLKAVLQPVRPSSNYVNNIRRRINFKAPVEVAQHLRNRPSLLVILGGVLSVSLLIITAARAVFYLVNRSKL